MMNQDLQHYTLIGEALYYPREGYGEKVAKMLDLFRERYPEAYEEIDQFIPFVEETELLEIQELYTRSFEVQSITTMDIGYVLFGDDYKRGALLANLSREHRLAGIDCRNELQDHLPNVLRLLPRLQDRVLVEEMVGQLIIPALKKIVAEFAPKRIQSKNKVYLKHHKTILQTSEIYSTVYREPLAALLKVFRADFAPQEYELPRQSKDFLGAIGTEMQLEPLK